MGVLTNLVLLLLLLLLQEEDEEAVDEPDAGAVDAEAVRSFDSAIVFSFLIINSFIHPP